MHKNISSPVHLLTSQNQPVLLKQCINSLCGECFWNDQPFRTVIKWWSETSIERSSIEKNLLFTTMSDMSLSKRPFGYYFGCLSNSNSILKHTFILKETFFQIANRYNSNGRYSRGGIGVSVLKIFHIFSLLMTFSGFYSQSDGMVTQLSTSQKEISQ